MASATYKEDANNYDDVINVTRNLYFNTPNMDPDKGVYDDISNVKPAKYENVLSNRMEQHDDRLVSTICSL